MRPGRPPTGAPQWNERTGMWEARVWRDGVRVPIEMPNIPREDRETAVRLAKLVAKRDRAHGYVGKECPETVSEWFDRWADAREAKGKRTRDDRGRFKKWIEPRMGTKPITEIVRRDVEELVQALDAAVLRGELAWKTAINVWAVTSKMFKDACHSKVLELRVLKENPAQGVEGPDHGSEREGAYLYPREFAAVMACKRVPTRWKRIFALATYLYCRGGELAGLEWSAVNLTMGFVSFHQSETEDDEIKTTKTGRNRKTPIEPTLLPLLTAMHEAAKGEGRVITTMPPREEWAARLRKYVRWALEDAGIPVRAELLADDETRRQLTFHDLRHTGITWRAIRGDDFLKVQRAAGHTNPKTTQRYINEAETFDAAVFGEVFPPLSTALAGPDNSGGGSGFLAGNFSLTSRNHSRSAASPAGVEPALAT